MYSYRYNNCLNIYVRPFLIVHVFVLLVAPAPSNADQVLGSICAQENPTVPGDFSWPWAFPRGSKRRPVNCNLIENLAYVSDYLRCSELETSGLLYCVPYMLPT